MPYGSVTLLPGVNVEKTPTLLQTSISVSQLIRFKDSLVQKLGGWMKFFGTAVAGVPRDLHAWQDLNTVDHLAVGTTTQLGVITSSSYQNITPQTTTTNPAVNFTTVAGSAIIVIVDTAIGTLTTFDSVLLNTPVAIGGLILSGLYPVTSVVGAQSYRITAASAAIGSETNAGTIPVFTTSSGTVSVSVLLAAHGLSVGNTIVFSVSTTGNGVTISGSYTVVAVADVNNFTITVNAQATASSSFPMNGGNAQFVYYIALGPPALGAGYGTGTYGSGGYGTGVAGSAQIGTPITATDWTLDNWGQLLMACPAMGGVYQFDPTGGFINASLVSGAPIFNSGIFVSMSQQILVCYGSTQIENIGLQQDPLLVKWSTVGDFTVFTPLVTNQAGAYRIGIGSKIIGGMAAQNQNLIWTDLDLWAMNYQGPPFVFGFNKIGSGAGLVSMHAAQALRGKVFWMGQTNFYVFDGNGVSVLPCPVWDFVFQNLTTNTAYYTNIRSLPNTPFNEAGWAFPSTSSSNGENDSYVKFNLTEPNQPWDYGSLPRSASIDQTVLGTPIQATPTGIIYQQESGNDADGQPLMASFTTGYFYIAEGEEFAFVDQIIPDFKWTTYGGTSSAQVQMSFNVINYMGDTPITYGPYTVNSATEYISTRFRGRQMSISISSGDVGSFWRIGKCRYRYAPAGRR